MSESRQLRGWKEIADHLGVSERSAKRWEQTHRLPVHRVRGAARDTVFADSSELNQWRSASDVIVATGSPTALETSDDGDHGQPEPAPRAVAHERRTFWRRLTFGLVTATVAVSAFGTYVWSGHARAPLPAPTIVLQLSTADGWTAKVSVRDGQQGTVTIGGRATMTLRPHLNGDVVLLDVGAPQGLQTSSGSSPSGIHLQRSVAVRVMDPIPFDVEWVATRPAKAIN